MKFSLGEHVRVNDGGVPWYGQVVAVLPPRQYRVRVGGTGGDTQMLCELDETKLATIIEGRVVKPKSKSVLKPVLDAHRLLLLGCGFHGSRCSETLVNYAASFSTGENNRPFGTIFLEGFYFDAKSGLDESKIKFNADKLLLHDLRKICFKVIGLETEETCPIIPQDIEGMNKASEFCNTKRCTVAELSLKRRCDLFCH